MEAAAAQIELAVQTATAGALAEISAHLEQQSARTEALLSDARQEATAVVRLMEEVLDSAAETGERMDRQCQEAYRTTVESLADVHQRAEREMNRVLAHGDERSKRLLASAEDLVREARALRARLGWKVWGSAAGLALGTVLLLTLLRPGWTMSAEQRRALRVGEAVIYTYGRATLKERAEMRRANRWRAPLTPDSTGADRQAGDR